MAYPPLKQTAKIGLLITTLVLAGCNDVLETVNDKANHPLPENVKRDMRGKGMTARSPIMMRIFKEESMLEVWKQKPNGRYEMIADYEICKWSGELGPKHKEGDKQAPEGFYYIRPHQMNPNSSFYLSFNMGFPNKFDRSHGRTGSHLMVHGACSSAGCYSMTDEQILEIYGFARDAFKGGQKQFLVQAFPFRMTPENMARHREHEDIAFWQQIKEGYDHFEITKKPPKVDVCDRKYVFNQTPEGNQKFRASAACPAMSQPELLINAYNNYQKDYLEKYTLAVQNEIALEEKEAQAELKKLEEERRILERKELLALRAEQRANNPSPIASLFSSNNANPKNSGLYSDNSTSTLQGPTPVTIAEENSASENIAIPVPQPNPNTVVAAQTKPPRWQFWKRN